MRCSPACSVSSTRPRANEATRWRTIATVRCRCWARVKRPYRRPSRGGYGVRSCAWRASPARRTRNCSDCHAPTTDRAPARESFHGAFPGFRRSADDLGFPAIVAAAEFRGLAIQLDAVMTELALPCRSDVIQAYTVLAIFVHHR